jgi:hypothetical protein
VLCRFFGHLLRPVQPCIDVAVPAGLITEFADVDLKNGDTGGMQRAESDSIELCFKRGQLAVFRSFNCSGEEARGLFRPSKIRGMVSF